MTKPGFCDILTIKTALLRERVLKMEKIEFFLASSLEKVFPTIRPEPLGGGVLSAWAGMRAAVQLVYRAPGGAGGSLVQKYRAAVHGAPEAAELFAVELVPSDFPCWEAAGKDDNYLTKEPGLFPDLLKPLQNGEFRPVPRQYRSIWISLPVSREAVPGNYPVTIEVRPVGDGETVRLTFVLRVGRCRLGDQKLIHTEWFHADCLASYYRVEPLSEAHWEILERFIWDAGRRHGVNMLLTPVFTPPLDTEVGGERPTVQLVGVRKSGGKYSFDFTDLERWTRICRENGIRYLEIAHFFTQWGAHATPKIMAEADGKLQRIFGWDVPADSPAYREFLEAFVPALRAALERFGFDREHVYFHISDEPSEKNLDSYLAAKRQVIDLLEGCPVVDALSSFQFYQQGIVQRPIPANDHIQPFFDANVPDLWVYYCCVQGTDVPNRFYAMPSARNRIMGVLMYLYKIRGFLHWGYNFYYTQFSRALADPFAMTHAGYAFPSGDPYLVYPGENGEPWTSIRAEVQSEALADLRALEALERKAGRDETVRIIRGGRPEPFTFRQYPKDAAYLLELRERIFDALEA